MNDRTLPDQPAKMGNADSMSIEQFLYHEARLMDEHRFAEWLALWDDKALYWVPYNSSEPDPSKASIIYDDRAQLEQRIVRLQGKHAYSQQPRSHLVRLLSNVLAGPLVDDAVEVSSTFILGEWRYERQTALFGRSVHLLIRTANGFKIRSKQVLLLNADGAHGNMTYLL